MAVRRGKIAVVVPSIDDFGGVATVAEFLLRTISETGEFDLRVISLSSSASDPCSLLIRRPRTWLRGVATREGMFRGIPFTHVGASLGELEIRRYAPRAALVRILSDCDIIQVIAGAPAWAWPFVGLGKPIVLQVASLIEVERRSALLRHRFPSRWWRQLMTNAASRIDRAALNAVDAIMVENNWMLEVARQNCGPGAIIRFAPPGVNVNVFHPLIESHSELEVLPYVLAVGRSADRRKNIGMLLDAFAEARRIVPQLRLALVDPDGTDSEFRKKVVSLGLEPAISVHLRVSEVELARLYRNALCLALSSDEEGFGMVVVEAMASGIPVIATKCGGPQSIITDKSDGFLVSVGDSRALADRIVHLALNPERCQEMGKTARKTAEQKYSRERTGDAFLSVYQGLLRRPEVYVKR